jgi:hypothetical protein
MTAKSGVDAQVREALASLEAYSTPKDVGNLARFGINAKNALGVSMANIRRWLCGWSEPRTGGRIVEDGVLRGAHAGVPGG